MKKLKIFVLSCFFGHQSFPHKKRFSSACERTLLHNGEVADEDIDVGISASRFGKLEIEGQEIFHRIAIIGSLHHPELRSREPSATSDLPVRFYR